MGDICQFTPRHSQQRNTQGPGIAEVIIFPGVRVERSDDPDRHRIMSNESVFQRITKKAVWTDD